MKQSLISLLIAGLFIAICGCYSSHATGDDKQIQGKPLNNHVAIVYSDDYMISLAD
jgi:hypothetical protein